MKERDLLTRMRNLFITDKNSSIEKWKDYCYVPLDIPRIDCPEIVDWLFNVKKDSERTRPSLLNPEIKKLELSGAEVYYNGSMESKVRKTSKYRTPNPRQEFVELFPDFYNKIISVFPFKSFNYVMFINSTGEVPWHRDFENVSDNPSQFRIMLYDDNPSETFGLVHVLPDEDVDLSNKVSINRFPETNSFAWNNLRVKHGSSFDPNYKKVLIGLVDYELDVERYHDLMERSVAKYKDYLMKVEGPTSDYINT